MKLVLTGATGFAGGEVLRQALLDDRVEQVCVLTRRPTGVTHPKLKELVTDFREPAQWALTGYDACAWCLGVSQGSVSEADYVTITHDFAVNAWRALRASNPSMRFLFVSGRSADPTERARALYARIKGRTERSLVAEGGEVVVLRPGYIKASAASGPRKDLARFVAPVAAVMGLFLDDFSVGCDQLARCVLGVARLGATTALLDNRAILAWRDPA